MPVTATVAVISLLVVVGIHVAGCIEPTKCVIRGKQRRERKVEIMLESCYTIRVQHNAKRCDVTRCARQGA